MHKERRMYVHMSALLFTIAMLAFVFKMFRIPGDTYILIPPSITIHDFVYFNTENVINFFLLAASLNIVFYIPKTEENYKSLKKLELLLILFTSLILNRTLFNLFIYNRISLLEYIVHGIVVIFIIFEFLKIKK